jgi:phosphoglycolate phosphatase
MGVEPAQCAFVGDSGIDMETANRAGMESFGALWGYQDGKRLIEAGAKVLLADPRDLLRHIQG